MQEKPRFLAVSKPDLKQLINKARANFSIPNNLGKLLVKEFVSPFPRDFPMCFWEEEGNKCLEILFNRLLAFARNRSLELGFEGRVELAIK
jgi:hypothetical protein